MRECRERVIQDRSERSPKQTIALPKKFAYSNVVQYQNLTVHTACSLMWNINSAGYLPADNILKSGGYKRQRNATFSACTI